MKKRVLCVDDENGILEVTKEFLEASGAYQVTCVSSGRVALDILARERFDAVICDYQMPSPDGLEVLEALRGRGDRIPFIIFTGRGREEVVLRAFELGVDFYVQKGGEPRAQYAELEQKLARALRERELEASSLDQRKLMEKIFETVPEEITVVRSRDMTVLEANEQALRRVGLPAEQVIGHSGLFLTQSLSERDLNRLVRELTEKGHYEDLELETRQPDGGRVPYLFSGRMVDIHGDACTITVARNIGPWREAERRMLESEGKLNALIQSATVGMHIYHLEQGRLVFRGSNAAADEILGIDHSLLVGKTLEEAFPPLTGTEVAESYLRVASKGGSWHGDSVEYADQRIVGVYEVHAFQLSSGQVMVMFKDVTEQHLMQKRLSAASSDLASLSGMAADLASASQESDVFSVVAEQVMSMTEAVFVSFSRYDAQRDVMVVEAMHGMKGALQRIVRMLGMNPVGMEIKIDDPVAKASMLTGKLMPIKGGLAELTIGQVPMTLVVLAERVLKVGNVYAIGFVRQGELLGNSAIVLRKGARLDAKVVEAIYYQASVALQRRKAEEALRESEARYRMLVESTGDIVYSMTPDGTVAFVGPQVQHYGYQASDLVGLDYLRMIHPEDRARTVSDLADMVAQGDAVASTFRVVDAKGGVHWMDNNARVLRDEKGRPALITGVLRDITGRVRSEEALIKANRKLGLLGNVTRHDLTNDLVALRGHLDLVDEGSLSPPSRKHLEGMRRITERIRSEIEFAKDYENVGIKEPEWQDLAKVVDRAGEKKDLRGIRFVNQVQHVKVLADPLLPRVFDNLIDNSLRHAGGASTIRLSTRTEDQELIVVYEDDGTGLTPDDRMHLFERGYGRNTGLGLFLCREILQLTGMSIDAVEPNGRGARFEIRVPRGMHGPEAG